MRPHELFSLLSDPTRLSIVELLSAHKSGMSVGQLAKQLRAKEPSVSQHLKALRTGGLVRGEKQGRSVVYRIDSKAPRTFRQMTSGLPGSRAKEVLRLSARNRLAGEVVAIEKDTVTSAVTLDVGGQKVQAVITTQALDELGLEVGDSAFAVVKATEVMLMR